VQAQGKNRAGFGRINPAGFPASFLLIRPQQENRSSIDTASIQFTKSGFFISITKKEEESKIIASCSPHAHLIQA